MVFQFPYTVIFPPLCIASSVAIPNVLLGYSIKPRYIKEPGLSIFPILFIGILAASLVEGTAKKERNFKWDFYRILVICIHVYTRLVFAPLIKDLKLLRLISLCIPIIRPFSFLIYPPPKSFSPLNSILPSILPIIPFAISSSLLFSYTFHVFYRFLFQPLLSVPYANSKQTNCLLVASFVYLPYRSPLPVVIEIMVRRYL